MSRIILLVIIAIIGNSYEREVKTLSISSANNHLALQLLQHLYSDDSNVFFSPFSISSAFAMLYLGANNSTADEMREVLGYSSTHLTRDDVNTQFETVLREIADIDSTNYELDIANRAVVQKDFNILDTYQQNLRKYYQSSIESADFVNNAVAATDAINEWVKQQTHNKIEKILSQPLSANTRLVLLNAVYFKGSWQTKFAKNETVKEVFYNRGIESFTTEMMKRNGIFNYTEIDELDSKLLELPYTGDDISMYILLPRKVDGFNQLKSKLVNFETIESGITNLMTHTVHATIPKFKFEASYSLDKQLSELGMKQLFTPAADLSGIDGKKDLFVSGVLHKAVIEVNEEGSEAAAVTAIIVGTTAVHTNPAIFEFQANHPFVFFIKDNRNGMILFVGHINKL